MPAIILIITYLGVFICAIIAVILFNIIIRICISIRNKKLNMEEYKDIESLHRDINVKYSPAVLSYLYNQKIEIKKDLIATIINLYNKKVIKIVKDQNGYNFIPLNCNIDKLTEDERYVYEHLIKHSEEKFSIDTWKSIVAEEYKKYDFSNYEFNKSEKEGINVVGFILIIFSSVVIADLTKGKYANDIGSITWFLIVFLFVYITGVFLVSSILNIRKMGIKLNEKGKSEFKKWLKFRRFMEEYTLISEKKIEEVIIYEQYIPYSMVLGINKEYKNKELKNCINEYEKVIEREFGDNILY